MVSSGGITGTHNIPLIEEPCIVIGRKGSIGSVYYMEEPCFPIDTVFYTQGSDHIHLKYLYYLLKMLPLTHMNNDSAVPGLNRAQAEELDVEIPSLGEQRAIAATLGALDDKIESNQRVIACASMLLESFSILWGSRLSLKTLGELAVIQRKTVNPSKLNVDLVDHYSLPAFDDKQVPERVDPGEIKSNKSIIPSDAVLVSRLNPRIDRSWWVKIDPKIPSLASTEFACLTASADTELEMVWLTVRHPLFQDSLLRRTTGTSGSHQRVRPDDVMLIEVPDFSGISLEQSQLALSLLQAIPEARKENQKLAELRDTLLPELISGRIRVPEARGAIEQEVG